jgi:hypothetical protein
MSSPSNATIDYDLMRLYQLNHSLHQPWYSVFVALYSILILAAFGGNLLILGSVFRFVVIASSLFFYLHLPVGRDL